MTTIHFNRINYLWRLLVTGICFAGFALGGGLLSILVLPILCLAPGSPQAKRMRARKVVGFMFGLMIRTLHNTGTIRFNISGLERLHKYPGTLILANHPTLIDVVILLWLYPQASCVVKTDLWKNPFHWGVVRIADYIDNSSPESLIDSCVNQLTAGESLVIFPEGTRTRPGKSLQFMRGASRIALANSRPILPVIITCTPPTLTKGEPWYRIPERAVKMEIVIHEPLPLEQLVSNPDPSPIGVRRLTEALESYFTHELNAYGCT